jgi:hypothetical protein
VTFIYIVGFCGGGGDVVVMVVVCKQNSMTM